MRSRVPLEAAIRLTYWLTSNRTAVPLAVFPEDEHAGGG
jgi:hypothetical protein